MEIAKKKLGILLSRGPDHPNLETALGLGVVSGENEVTFVLRGPGVHLLDADTDELVDGDDIAKFRGNLKALGIPFHVEETAIPPDPDWNADGHPIVPVSPERIADLVRQSRRALVF